MSGFDPSATSSHKMSSMATPKPFNVHFWGVRGSIPTPSPETIRYGGNTPCVELNVSNHRLIFDAGTGLRVLGQHLMESHEPVKAHIFFTHTHWDRIQGFPFFKPAFLEGNDFCIYGQDSLDGASIKQRLYEQMLRPHFPVALQEMKSNLSFQHLSPGSVINLDDVTVETVALNSPNRAVGYRVNCGNYSVVYATDNHLQAHELDQNLLYLANGADVLIYDAAYTDHSQTHVEAVAQQMEAWHTGVQLATAAKVKCMVMFHHDPTHDDDFLDSMESQVQAKFPNARLAREGMVLDVTAL